MSAATEHIAHSFMITEEERIELIRLLEQACGESRIEMHRTHTPEYRQRVSGEQAILSGLLEKFQHTRSYE